MVNSITYCQSVAVVYRVSSRFIKILFNLISKFEGANSNDKKVSDLTNTIIFGKKRNKSENKCLLITIKNFRKVRICCNKISTYLNEVLGKKMFCLLSNKKIEKRFVDQVVICFSIKSRHYHFA